MSPSGSRMQISGTMPAPMPFCRRASLSRASGVKTEGARWFLRRRIGGGFPISSCFGAVIALHPSRSRAPAGSSNRSSTRYFGQQIAPSLGHAEATIEGISLPALVHGDGDYHTRGEGEGADDGDGPGGAEQVGHDAGRERADRIAHVTPEAVDAERARPPRGVGGVGHRGMSVG